MNREAEEGLMPEYLFIVNVANLAQWAALVFGLTIGVPLVIITIQNAASALSKPPPKG